MTLFWLFFVLFILLGEFLVQSAASLLNLRALEHQVPELFQKVIDKEEYAKSQDYTRATIQFSLCQETLLLVIIIGFLLGGGFPFLDGLAQHLGQGPISTGLIFIASLLLLIGLLNLPFSLYSTFVIEEQFGFNNTTLTTFLLDQLKIILLSFFLGIPLLSLILWFFESTGDMAWVYCWLCVCLFSIVLQLLAPVLILPLFNKFTPIGDEVLKNSIMAYCKKESFQLQGIYTMDGSKRSSKLNAFFTGFGRFKKIVFYDTLIQKLSDAEIVSVLAHEMGHYKHHHLYKQLVLSIGQSALLFYILSLMLGNVSLAQAFGLNQPSTYTSLVIFTFLYTPINLLLNCFTNFLSRQYEFQADLYAHTSITSDQALLEALKKLSKANLSNLTPHPFYVFLHYSHPPVTKRIKQLMQYQLP
ncbi:MAG: M48 family metallopeptidase [Proteobacteria bacterium]|nr:M48 family metallopeptidase [Pseudomonadota bacterium]MBU1057014.1 M48 family metallopeptidase [Pseudomonadota bacterium]